MPSIWVVWCDLGQSYSSIMTSTNGYTWVDVPSMFGIRRTDEGNYASIIVNGQKYLSLTYDYSGDKRTYFYRWNESTSEWITIEYKIA